MWEGLTDVERMVKVLTWDLYVGKGLTDAERMVKGLIWDLYIGKG